MSDPDRWVAQYDENNPAGTFFAHQNELGTNVAWTNWAGAQTTDQTFYPWGGDWQTSGSPEQRFARTDMREPYLGMDTTANRMYNSNLGRWLTPDPAGKGAVQLDDPQTWNMYAYTRNNFTTLTNPTGLLEADPGSTAQQHQEQSAGTQRPKASGAGEADSDSTTGQSQAQNESEPAVSVTVEGGVGEEAKLQLGPVEAKAGAAVKGEVEVSSAGVKVSAKAEADAHVGPVKLGGVEVGIVTRNEKGESEKHTVALTPPGISGKHNSEATVSTREFTIGVSAYHGGGGGVSVTVRPAEVVKALNAAAPCGCDFNTNQHGVGAWQ